LVFAMATIKQLYANRLNALRSTGPRSTEGKERSRSNAVQHGLTAETVISALEDAADYAAFEQSVAADYNPTTTTERELVARLASVLWRLRRSTRLESGLLQIQAELLKGRQLAGRRNSRQPEWYDELDVAASRRDPSNAEAKSEQESEVPQHGQDLAYCFLQVGRLQLGTFDTLARYEVALWRQAAQLIALLHSLARRG
jgi:hypothetical protein